MSRPLMEEPSREVIQARREAARKAQAMESEREFLKRVGRRYAQATVDNFEVGSDQESSRRMEALSRIEKFQANMMTHIKDGGSVVLAGPPGTGKDHLMVALLREAIRKGASVQWTNGQELFRQFRDQIDTNKTEASFVASFSKADILAISDPVPPKGEASSYAAHMLYQIIDARYRDMKSVWVTANVATRSEGIETLTAPIFDRLLDNSFTVFCNWPSYRSTRKPEWLK